MNEFNFNDFFWFNIDFSTYAKIKENGVKMLNIFELYPQNAQYQVMKNISKFSATVTRK